MLSFDSLLGSGGAVVVQPLLGRPADVWSQPVFYLFTSAIQAVALPFLWLARGEQADADVIAGATAEKEAPSQTERS